MDYAVVLAGGAGKRLWPLSRESRPKQMLKLLDGQTLLSRCFDRLTAVCDLKNIFVLTNACYVDLVRENLPYLPYDNVIAEPCTRDTASAIGLAASVISKYDPDATMAVVTSDQLIRPTKVFQQAVIDAIKFVKRNPESMLTFGIKPTCPATQLGYIKMGSPVEVDNIENTVHKVDAFKEKPNEATAKKYLMSDDYAWNSGMFVWKARTILSSLFKFLPESQEPLENIQAAWGTSNQQQALETWFVKLPKISIDYAVMEHASNVHAIKLNCSWLDMGSFTALADVIESDENNNIVAACACQIMDCKNSIFVTEDKEHLIAAIDMENVVVAHSADATLVCPVGKTEKLKELLEKIKAGSGKKYL